MGCRVQRNRGMLKSRRRLCSHHNLKLKSWWWWQGVEPLLLCSLLLIVVQKDLRYTENVIKKMLPFIGEANYRQRRRSVIKKGVFIYNTTVLQYVFTLPFPELIFFLLHWCQQSSHKIYVCTFLFILYQVHISKPILQFKTPERQKWSQILTVSWVCSQQVPVRTCFQHENTASSSVFIVC